MTDVISDKKKDLQEKKITKKEAHNNSFSYEKPSR